MKNKKHILFAVLAYAVCIFDNNSITAKTNDINLQDPVTLGAVIFNEKCLRCHTGVAQIDLAEEFDNKEELIIGLSGEGCNINWSQKAGGPFDKDELTALAEYLLQINKTRSLIHTPNLSNPHHTPRTTKSKPQETKKTSKAKKTKKNQLPPSLQKLVNSNSIAKGGWLYIKNCYRCHLTYQQARMGKNLPVESITRIISEGKTSTQMKPFSRMLGGNLKNNQITAIAEYIFTWEKNEEPLAIADELMTPPALDPAEYKPIRLSRFKPVNGDNNNGEILYTTNCHSCHGINKEGFIGSSLQHRAEVRRDLYIKSIIKNGVPGSLMKAWGQNHGGLLSAKQIDDVVSHILL